MQRWIAIGVVCFSAALLSACGGAPATALASKSDASAMSRSDGRYGTSSKHDKDECDESEDQDHDKSNDKSRSLSTKSKDADDKDCDKECKDSDDDHDKSKDGDKSKDKSSHSIMSSKSSSKDKDGKDNDHDDDDANCKVTVCHVPPGNACKEHKIRVGKSAVRAHIEHGDYLGSCDAPPPPPQDPPPPAQCVPEFSPCILSADCCTPLSCGLDGLCGIIG